MRAIHSPVLRAKKRSVKISPSFVSQYLFGKAVFSHLCLGGGWDFSRRIFLSNLLKKDQKKALKNKIFLNEEINILLNILLILNELN